MEGPLSHHYAAMPGPKVVLAAGTDAISGGLIHPELCDQAGISSICAVDVSFPGSPPSPFSLLPRVLLAIGLLPASLSDDRRVAVAALCLWRWVRCRSRLRCRHGVGRVFPFVTGPRRRIPWRRRACLLSTAPRGGLPRRGVGVGRTSVRSTRLAGLFLTLIRRSAAALSACSVGWARPVGRVARRGDRRRYLLLLARHRRACRRGTVHVPLRWETMTLAFSILVRCPSCDKANARPAG